MISSQGRKFKGGWGTNGEMKDKEIRSKAGKRRLHKLWETGKDDKRERKKEETKIRIGKKNSNKTTGSNDHTCENKNKQSRKMRRRKKEKEKAHFSAFSVVTYRQRRHTEPKSMLIDSSGGYGGVTGNP